MDEDIKDKVKDILDSMENIHFPSGCVYFGRNKLNALTHSAKNELETIVDLVESLGLFARYTAVERFQKARVVSNQDDPLLDSNKINFTCKEKYYNNKIETLLSCLSEMPKEWTIVQLTSAYHVKENLNVASEMCYTNSLHVTVLNCGHNQLSPFTITLELPQDDITGKNIEILQELYKIIQDNEIHLTEFCTKFKNSKQFISQAEKLIYVGDRNSLNNRLENLVDVVQNKWLNPWRCLFISKFVNTKIEEKVKKAVDEILKDYNYKQISKQKLLLLTYLMRGGGYLSLSSSKHGLKYIFPKDEEKNIRCAFLKLLQSAEYNFEKEERHPLILIIDEQLDCVPWEMIDILKLQSVSRLPSLHFAYSLFKEHEQKLVNGRMEIHDSSNGKYMLNPGLDLNAMERRMNNFFKYWRPDWHGIVGMTPSEDDFIETLTTADIFVYCGHGNGTQFLRVETIQRAKINAIVFLFGCGSIKLKSLGPQAEIWSSYFSYLIASSPCVIGMLWTVTDCDTDNLSTEIFSQWIPSQVQTPWKLIAKDKWEKEGTIQCIEKIPKTSTTQLCEPELLKALANAKQMCSGKYLTRASCIARGLPVKIIT